MYIKLVHKFTRTNSSFHYALENFCFCICLSFRLTNVHVDDSSAGACGFGAYGRTVNDANVAGVSRLWNNGTGCGACYQVMIINFQPTQSLQFIVKLYNKCVK